LPQETITREAALKAFTADAAYAGFAEGRFGRLYPGERADFILIDTDPFLASPSEIRKIEVRETWTGGERVFLRE
jgi:predicted amidohydrolase YtcJ